MGKRGPKPTPRRILELSGSWRARRNGREPLPPRGVPRCPTFLGRFAKSKYRELAARLDEMGLLTVIDGDMLAAYCQAWEEFISALKLLITEGRTVKLESGYIQPHPAVAMQRSAWQAMRQFGSLFGLDPSSRTRLEIPEQPPEENDPMEEFLNRKRSTPKAG